MHVCLCVVVVLNSLPSANVCPRRMYVCGYVYTRQQGKGKPPGGTSSSGSGAKAAAAVVVAAPPPLSSSSVAAGGKEGEEDEGEAVAEFVAECEMPTDRGTFRMRSYR